MGTSSQSSVLKVLRAERLTVDYLHLNQTPIRLNGYPLGTADFPNTANFISSDSLQQPDWLTVNTSSASFIKNKPQLSQVALSGEYADLQGAPDQVPVNADWNEQDATKLDFVRNKPVISAVGSSGKFSDLVPGSGQPTVPTTVDYDATVSSGTTLAIINKPAAATQPVNADWNVASAASLAFVRNKPSLSAVALSGSFGDLLNRPTVYQSVDWNANASSGTTLAIANRPSIPNAQVNSDWSAASGAAAILNKPSVPAAQVNADWSASSGAAAVLNKPTIPAAQVNSDWNATSGSVAYIANKPSLGKAAVTNSYGDLSNLPTIPAAQQPSDWNAGSGAATYIANRPTWAAAAYSGKYSDLLANSGQPTLPTAVDWSITSSTSTTLAIKNRPTIPAAQVQSDWSQTDSTQLSFIASKPALAAVATSGSYNDLSNRPTVNGTVQGNWTQTDSTQGNFIQNKPSLSTVATSGLYSDLAANSGQPAAVTAADWTATSASNGVVPVLHKPTIPAAQVNSDWNSTSGASQILNVPTFGAAAYSNKYSDLSGTPSQTNADWNSTSGASQILNRPSLGLVATSNNYGDLTGLPVIPTAADYSLSSSSGASLAVLNKPTNLSAFTNDVGYYKANSSPSFASVTATSVAVADGTVSVDSGYPLTLAADLVGSIALSAGTLSYNPPGGNCTPASSSSGSVDLYGAGTSTGSRLLNLWDLVTVQGTLTVSGSASLQAVTATTLTASGAVSTGALTAASIATGGNLSVSGTLGVSGASTLQAVSATTVTASGAVSTGALTAASVSTGGNLTVTGTAAIAGATSTHALTATSVVTSGTLSATGSSTLAALTATSFANSGNETISGNLSVTGTASTGALSASSFAISASPTTAGISSYGALTVPFATTNGNLQVNGLAYTTETLGASTTTYVTGGTYTSSSNFSGTDYPASAFDNNSSTFWRSGQTYSSGVGTGAATTVSGNTVTGEWIQIQTANPFVPTAYTVTSATSRNVTWVVAGSNDGATWVSLDVYSGGATASSTRSIVVPTTTYTGGPSPTVGQNSYTYLRFIVTLINAYANCYVNELVFTGNLASYATVPAGATVVGNCSVSGNSTTAGTLGVTGASTLAALSVTSVSNSGNETIAGTLGVTGASTLAALTATSVTNKGNETIAGTLGVVGASSLAALAATSFSNLGNETVAGTLGVTGASTLAALTATSFSNTGNETIAGTLGVTGATTLAGKLTVSSTVGVGTITALNASMGTSSVQSILLGQSSSNNNVAQITYNYASSGSSSNNISLGLYGTTQPLTVYSNNVAVTGALGVSGVTTATTGVNLPGAQVVNFGSDQTKTTSAGNIGYQALTVGALDIVGAGTSSTSRIVKLWDTLYVAGNYVQLGMTLGGPMSMNNEGYSTIYNMSNNFRETNVNTANLGGMFRIDNRGSGTAPQFQWCSRPAGSSTESTVASLSNVGALTLGSNLSVTNGSVATNLIDGSASTSSNMNYYCNSGLSHVWTVGAGGSTGMLLNAGIGLYPCSDNQLNLGYSNARWKNFYAVNLIANGTGSSITQPAWIAVSFQNGWTNYGGLPQTQVSYMKDSMGFVHLQGVISGGTNAATAFTLPAGYRSSTYRSFLVCNSLTDSGYATWINLPYNTGAVTITSPSGASWVDIGGISFLADA